MPPAKLLYKGSLYRLAYTDDKNIWKTSILPRLESLVDTAANDDLSDYDKRIQAGHVLPELKEYFKLLGIW
jgi:hypothetical protein